MDEHKAQNSPDRYRPGPRRVALAAAAFTWPLLFVGGLVTTYRVGMAVPDWPTTFGMNMFLYDFVNASWGVFIEHGHRLYGSAVGLATIALAVWFTLAERRRWLVALGWFALAAVIVQGVLGGYRVLQNSTLLAAVHGCTGQAFFGLMAAIVVFTGRTWQETRPESADPAGFRARSTLVLAAAYAQVVLGAWLRHFGSTTSLVSHAVAAAAVFVLAAELVGRVERRKATAAGLVPAARALGATLLVQVALGVAAWWMLRPFDGIARPVSTAQALIRTGHQANAALLLASAVVLTLRARRLFHPSPRPGRHAGEPARLAAEVSA